MFNDKISRLERMQDIRMTASEKALLVLPFLFIGYIIVRIGMSL